MNSWFLLALLGSMIGAVVHIVDTYLREDNVFERPLEPTIISGGMQAMLWIIVPFVGFSFPEDASVFALAFCGGILHLASLFFYFKAVFVFRDMSVISLLWNLILGAVPLLAFLFLHEVLSGREYFGIALLFSGATVLSYSKTLGRRAFLQVFFLMLAAVFLMAISMVSLKAVFESTSYWSGYLAYNLGIVFAALGAYVCFMGRRTRSRLQSITKNFFGVFFCIEFLQLAGEFCSNRAVSLGPVSLVASIESLQAVFIIAFGWLAFFFFRFLYRKKEYLAIAVRDRQMNAIGVKIVAVSLMVWGVYLIG